MQACSLAANPLYAEFALRVTLLSSWKIQFQLSLHLYDQMFAILQAGDQAEASETGDDSEYASWQGCCVDTLCILLPGLGA